MAGDWFQFAKKVFRLAAIPMAAGFIAYFFPADMFQGNVAVLGSIVGLSVAAIVPTMIFAATSLRPGRRGLKEFANLKLAVQDQISFLSGLFLLTIWLAVALVVGEVSEWSLGEIVIPLPTEQWTEITISWTRILNFVVLTLSMVIIFRFSSLIAAVKQLFDLHTQDVEEQIRHQIEEDSVRVLKEIRGTKRRDGFGENIGTLGE